MGRPSEVEACYICMKVSLWRCKAFEGEVWGGIFELLHQRSLAHRLNISEWSSAGPSSNSLRQKENWKVSGKSLDSYLCLLQAVVALAKAKVEVFESTDHSSLPCR